MEGVSSIHTSRSPVSERREEVSILSLRSKRWQSLRNRLSSLKTLRTMISTVVTLSTRQLRDSCHASRCWMPMMMSQIWNLQPWGMPLIESQHDQSTYENRVSINNPPLMKSILVQLTVVTPTQSSTKRWQTQPCLQASTTETTPYLASIRWLTLHLVTRSEWMKTVLRRLQNLTSSMRTTANRSLYEVMATNRTKWEML